jgi:CO/xanthine dehydrogenase FAD-binding subunit
MDSVPLPAPRDDAPQIYMPTSLRDAAGLLAAHPTSLVVGANSGHVGVSKYYDGRSTGAPLPPPPATLVITERIAELNVVEAREEGPLTLGASVPLATLLDKAEARATSTLGCRWTALASHLHRVANYQVRAVGTIGGNLKLAHDHGLFASDLALLLTALSATVQICDVGTCRTLTLPMKRFFTTSMAHRLIVAVSIPPPPTHCDELFFSFKVALRAQNAHALINAAFAFHVAPSDSRTVQSALLCYGGLRQHEVTSAAAASAALVGTNLGSARALEQALSALDAVAGTLDPAFDRDALRATCVRTLFYSSYLRACVAVGVPLSPSVHTASVAYVRPISSGTYDISGAAHPGFFPVSQVRDRRTNYSTCDPRR